MNKDKKLSGEKKSYQKPQLTAFGDVRTLTLVGSARVYEQQFESRSSRDDAETRGGRRGDE